MHTLKHHTKSFQIISLKAFYKTEINLLDKVVTFYYNLLRYLFSPLPSGSASGVCITTLIFII